MKRTSQLSFLLIMILSSQSIVYSQGCDCQKYTFKDKLKASQVIFVGEVVEIIPIEKRPQNAFKFRVERYWRGVTDPYITVISDWPVVCPGLYASVGDKFLIYAYNYEGQLMADPCISLLQENAEKELKKLGKGKVVQSTTPSNNSFNGTAN